MIKLVICWIYLLNIFWIYFEYTFYIIIYMYIYNYFIILLGVCVFYNTWFNTIHDTEKKKLIHDTIHDLTTIISVVGYACFNVLFGI